MGCPLESRWVIINVSKTRFVIIILSAAVEVFYLSYAHTACNGAG